MTPAAEHDNCARCDAPGAPERREARVCLCTACYERWLAQRKPVRELYSELRARVSPTLGGGQP